MISLFGSSPSNVSVEAIQTKPAAPAHPPAVSKAPAALPAPAPRRGWKWFNIGRSKRRLQMVESVSLGEKRFVALVQVDGRQFLIGGAPSNVGMLAELAPEESFHQVLKEATQGLDVPLPIPAPLAAKTTVAVSEPVATPMTASTPAKAMATETAAAVQATSAPEDVPVLPSTPASPIDPVPVDLAFEQHVSLSPSLLAAINAKPQFPEAPASQANLQEKTTLLERQTIQPEVVAPTVVELKAAGESIVGPESQEAEQVLPLVPAPKFTFQVSHFLNLGSKAATKPTAQKNDQEGSRRTAAAWNLQGATS